MKIGFVMVNSIKVFICMHVYTLALVYGYVMCGSLCVPHCKFLRFKFIRLFKSSFGCFCSKRKDSRINILSCVGGGLDELSIKSLACMQFNWDAKVISAYYFLLLHTFSYLLPLIFLLICRNE